MVKKGSTFVDMAINAMDESGFGCVEYPRINTASGDRGIDASRRISMPRLVMIRRHFDNVVEALSNTYKYRYLRLILE